jgi:hypothetical protein
MSGAEFPHTLLRGGDALLVTLASFQVGHKNETSPHGRNTGSLLRLRRYAPIGQ